MKKLLFVIPTLRMGGAEKALVSLLRSLDPEKVSVDLFLFEQGGVLQKQVPDWVNILPENVVTRGMLLEFRYHWLSLIRTGHLISAYRRLRSFLAPRIRKALHLKERFDWARTARAVPPLDGSYDAAIGFLEGVTDFFVLDKVTANRKIGWIHTDFAKKRLFPEEAALYRRLDLAATITPACAASFVQATGFPESRVSVIENIADGEASRRAADSEDCAAWDPAVPQLVTVARLEKQKGIDLALEACKLLKRKQINFCWHVLGDGSLRSWLKREIAANSLEDCFVLEGVKANPYPFMKRAYAIVQPSRTEGKSIVLDEAKILGKAIITTNYPSVVDQIENGVNGIVTEIRADAIAKAVANALADPDQIRRLENTNACTPDPSGEILRKYYQMLS